MQRLLAFHEILGSLKKSLFHGGGGGETTSLLLIFAFLSSQAAFFHAESASSDLIWSLDAPLHIDAPATGRYVLGTVSRRPPFEASSMHLFWLEYELELSITGPVGELRLWDDCHGWSATHLRLRLLRDRAGQPVITWDTLDLFSGIRVGYVMEKHLRITVRNITPDLWGHKPCTLTLVYAREGFLSLRSLHVLRGGFAALPTSSPTYRVSVSLPQGPLTEGKPFRLSVLAWNRSSISPPLVRVSLVLEDRHLEPLGPTVFVQQGKLVRHSFWILPRAPGTYRVGVQAVGPAGGETFWFGIQIIS